MQLSAVFPSLAEELRDLLERKGDTGLAGQVAALAIVERCRCGDEFCATIYTQPPPKGTWGPDHGTIDLDADQGMILLDVVQGKIVEIEILNRDDIRKTLLAILP